MRDLSLLTWLTQLGLSVAVPLAGFVLLAVWLRERFSLGVWVIIVGVILGLYCAVDGFLRSLKLLHRLGKGKEENPPPVSYNEHD